jgi:hypothetical protein
MLGILASLLSGGATGLLGMGIQKFFDYKSKKIDQEHEIALRKADAEIMREEWAARTKVAEVEGEAKVEVEDSKAFNTALTSEPKRFYEGTDYSPKQKWLMIGLDFIRGIVRPGLSLYLCAITTVIYFKAASLLDVDIILPGMAYDLVNQIIQTVLYLTTTCVLFWFGIRNRNK